MVYPETGSGTIKRVLGEEMRNVVGVRLFKEFADDKRFVQGFAFIFNGWNQSFRVNGCNISSAYVKLW